MREIYIALLHGLKERAVGRKERKALQFLLKHRFVNRIDDKYILNRKLILGTVDINRRGTGFLTPLDGKGRDLLVEERDLNGAVKGDLVIAKRVRGDRRASAEVLYVAHREDSNTLIYLDSDKFGKVYGFDLKTGQNRHLKASQKSLRQLPPLSVLQIDSVSGEVENVLGVLTDPAIDEVLSLALYSRTEEFSKSSLNQAKSFGSEVDITLYPDREDLTPYPFCTVDPDSAKDFDDALYYDTENRTLYVAIADVSEYVTANSPIDREARERGFSVYFPHKSVPMLPRELSENICSLKPDVDRLAFTFKIELSEDYSVKNSTLLRSVIHSHRRFTYSEVDRAFREKSDLGELNWIFELQKITDGWRKKRLKSGFDFRNRDVELKLNSSGEIVDTVLEDNTLSHQLIEESMLLANRLSSQMIDIGVYRNHDQPSERSLVELEERLSEIGMEFSRKESVEETIRELQRVADSRGVRDSLDQLIIRSLKQAKYESENRGHFGLGFERYTHFTSPIRRYSDLMLHRILKSRIDSDKKMERYLLQNIDAENIRVSELEREANKVMWDFSDRKFARWAFENIGQRVPVRIVEFGKSDMVGRAVGSLIEGSRIFVEESNGVELLDEVDVTVTDVNLANAKIYGRVAK